MILYHGTSERYVQNILDKGIIPRGRERRGNWQHTVPSNSKTVYLTEAYGPYFAFNAVPRGKVKNLPRAVVLEINTSLLDETKLVADEDAIEQATRNRDHLPKTWDMKKRTRYYRDKAWAVPYENSLRALGTCGYHGTVPSSSITRVCYIDPRERCDIALMALDATITLMNFQIVGRKYINLTRWLFGEQLIPEELLGFGLENIKDEQILKRMIAPLESLVKNRSGIEVVDLR